MLSWRGAQLAIPADRGREAGSHRSCGQRLDFVTVRSFRLGDIQNWIRCGCTPRADSRPSIARVYWGRISAGRLPSDWLEPSLPVILPSVTAFLFFRK